MTRKTYAKILKKEGYFLCASGFSRGRHKELFLKFFNIHQGNNLDLLEEELVWDPYGMAREDILVLNNNTPVKTYYDNTMFIFRKRG
jgi:hypothetical protein